MSHLSGTLRIGFVSGCIDASLSTHIAEFGELHRDVEISFVTASFEDPDAGLARNQCDVGMFVLPVATAGLALLPLRTEPIVILVAAGDPLATRDALTEEEIVGRPFPRITVTDQTWAHFWSLSDIRTSLPTHGSKVKTFSELVEAIACGAVVAPCIASFARQLDGRVVAVPIATDRVGQVVMGWHTTVANPIVDSFVRYIKGAATANTS
jgi:DNA-binding transcriptional LysR family regulator